MAGDVESREIFFVYGRYTTQHGESYDWTALLVNFPGGGELRLEGIAFDPFGVAVLHGKMGDLPGQQGTRWDERVTGVSFTKRYIEPGGLAIPDDIEYTAVCVGTITGDSEPWEGEWCSGELAGKILFCTKEWDSAGIFIPARDRQLALAVASLLTVSDEAANFDLDGLALYITLLRRGLRQRGLSR